MSGGMSLFILLAALLPWATSPASLFTRVFVAISLLSMEMQLVTVTRIGSLHALPVANTAVALLLAGWQLKNGSGAMTAHGQGMSRSPVPWAAAATMAMLVLFLNLTLPLEAADPYHLERIETIERTGTLAYDPAVEPKVNILGWVYELVLADLHQVPVLGQSLMVVHGMFGFALYTIAVAVACELLPMGIRWPAVVFMLVPAVFHQLVLIKNDLFVAAPAFVALAWLLARVHTAPWKSFVWVGWLIGFVVGYKLTNLPLVVIAVVATAFGSPDRPSLSRRMTALAAGVLAGVVVSGLLLTLWQNTLMYGDALATGPVLEIGNRTTSVADAARSVLRFGISLFDLGLVTPVLWPGRGGWGGTFGLPFIWATGVLLLCFKQAREARWALAAAACQFLALAAVFPDSDGAHRLALAPALLMITVALHLTGRPGRFGATARLVLVPVIAFSAAQILRSAVLYIYRA
jgi:hypothetical protein